MFISLPLYYSPRPLAATTWCPLAFGELNIYRQLIYRNVIHVHCPLQISVKFTLIFSCHSLCQFMSDARDCESYLRQLQETIKRQYTCDKNSRLSKLEDLLQDSMVQYLLPSAEHISLFFLLQFSLWYDKLQQLPLISTSYNSITPQMFNLNCILIAVHGANEFLD